MQPHQMGLILLPPVTLPVASRDTTQTLENYFGYTDPRTATIDYVSTTPGQITPTGTGIPDDGGTITPQIDFTSPITDQTIEIRNPVPTGGTSEGAAQAIKDAFADLQQQLAATYDMLLGMSLFDFTRNGYIIDKGSIFQSGKIVLALQDIQAIENERGTAGTLFMHFSEPVLAKDTAGYCCGNMRSQGATTLYSTPIAEVLAIPDPPTGSNVINDYNPPTPPGTTVTPLPPATNNSTTIPTPTTAGTTTMLPLLTVAGLAVLAVAGVQILKKRTGLVFAGGLGLLYYQLKTNTQ